MLLLSFLFSRDQICKSASLFQVRKDAIEVVKMRKGDVNNDLDVQESIYSTLVTIEDNLLDRCLKMLLAMRDGLWTTSEMKKSPSQP